MREFSGDPPDAEGSGAGPGPPPLNPSPSPQTCCRIHPIEVAPEAGLEPPTTGAKPGERGGYLPTAKASLTSWNSSQSTGLGPCLLQRKLLRWIKLFKVCESQKIIRKKEKPGVAKSIYHT